MKETNRIINERVALIEAQNNAFDVAEAERMTQFRANHPALAAEYDKNWNAWRDKQIAARKEKQPISA
jgi:hypothetical protein